MTLNLNYRPRTACRREKRGSSREVKERLRGGRSSKRK